MVTTIAAIVILSEAVGALILFYASYWALVIRRASVVALYRRQSFAIALIGVTFGLTTVGFSLTGGTGTSLLISMAGLSVLFIFYWIDAALTASRRSDLLLRDTMRWSRLRLFLWPGNLIILGFGFLFTGQLLPPLLVPSLLLGALGLPIAARRSMDPTFRSHLKWFGLFAGFLAVFFIGAGLNAGFGGLPEPANTVFLVAVIAAAFASDYSLYRSATSLAPLRRLPKGIKIS